MCAYELCVIPQTFKGVMKSYCSFSLSWLLWKWAWAYMKNVTSNLVFYNLYTLTNYWSNGFIEQKICILNVVFAYILILCYDRFFFFFFFFHFFLYNIDIMNEPCGQFVVRDLMCYKIYNCAFASYILFLNWMAMNVNAYLF